MTAKRLSLVFVWLALALGLSGCAHYRLGTGGALPFRTLYVGPVENRTTLPQAREILGVQVREAFLRDARVALVNSPAEADAVLSIVIADYHRDVAAVREGDTGLARKFDLVLGADCTVTLKDRTLFMNKRRVTASRQAFTDSGQLQAEYQTLPLIASALAGKIAAATVDAW